MWTSMDYPWIVTVKYKGTVSIHGWQWIVYSTIGHICKLYMCTHVQFRLGLGLGLGISCHKRSQEPKMFPNFGYTTFHNVKL